MYNELSDFELLKLGIGHMTRNQVLPSELTTTLQERNLYEYLYPSTESEGEDS